MPPIVYSLRDADIRKLALCKVGANKQRIFLLKSGEEDEQAVAAVAQLIKEPGNDWTTAYVPVAVPGAEENPGMFGDPESQDVWEADEIAKAAHGFMGNGAKIVAQHFDAEDAPGVTLVENAVALADFPVGETIIKEGTWYVGLEFDETTRDLVSKGEIDAVSVEGFAQRVAKAEAKIQEEDSFGPNGDAHPDTVNLDRELPYADEETLTCMAWCEGRGWAASGEDPAAAPDAVAKEIARLVKDAMLVPNKPGVTNWVERAGGLPKYIADIAGDLITERGMTTGHAIEVAVGVVRNWCHGKGNVTAATRAKACAASAEWEAKKARAHLAKENEPTPLLSRMAKVLGISADEDPACGFCIAPDVAGEADLEPAIATIDAAPEIARSAVRESIIKSARDLDLIGSLPESWDVAEGLRPDGGSVPGVDLNDRVSALEEKVNGLPAEIAKSLTEGDDAPLVKIAASVQTLAEKVAAAEPEKEPTKDELLAKLDEVATKQAEAHDEIEALVKSIEDLAEGDSTQLDPAEIAKSNGKDYAEKGILFD